MNNIIRMKAGESIFKTLVKTGFNVSRATAAILLVVLQKTSLSYPKLSRQYSYVDVVRQIA